MQDCIYKRCINSLRCIFFIPDEALNEEFNTHYIAKSMWTPISNLWIWLLQLHAPTGASHTATQTPYTNIYSTRIRTKSSMIMNVALSQEATSNALKETWQEM